MKIENLLKEARKIHVIKLKIKKSQDILKGEKEKKRKGKTQKRKLS